MKKDKTFIWRSALPPMAVVALSLALAFTSCAKEPLSSSDQPTQEYMDFALELTPPGAYTPTQSRSMTVAQQNEINRAEVLVFKDGILLYHKTGTVTDVDGVKKQVKVNLKTSQAETDIFDMVIIGNAPSTFDFASYLGKTKDEFKAGFNISVAGKWAGTEFVMYGEALKTFIKPTTNTFKIQMLRSLARIDIGTGAYDEATDAWAGLAGVFTLTEVRVVNSRDKFAVIPATTTLNESGNVKVSAPTLPAGTVAQGTDAATAIKYSGAEITETGVSTKSTIFIAEAPNTTDRVTLLIGGSYKGGATTYYRVDMGVPQAAAPETLDYLNVLRNHLYRISITSVSGAGFTDAQEALISAPLNMTTTLTPIAEGDAGDVLFDDNNYLMTDVSSVLIYGVPDGVTTYPIATVKATFARGVAATITGPGITTPLTLNSGFSKSLSIAIPKGTTTGSYTIKVGRLTKAITLRVDPPIDAHFDVLPFMNIASINVLTPQPWLTLSQNITYVKSEQQSSNVVGNADDKAYVHFDENIATTGEPRSAQALVLRTNAKGTTRIYFEQRNLSGMVFGKFGGAKDNYGYTKQLAAESVDEHALRNYDDTSIGKTVAGMQWGFNTKTTGMTDNVSGKVSTITLAKRTDSGITAPYTIYNSYAARYCYDKNRDIDGDGTISDDEILWYLPAQKQLMGVWIAHNAVSAPFGYSSPTYSEPTYWSSTEFTNNRISWVGDFGFGSTYGGANTTKDYTFRVRCVREF